MFLSDNTFSNEINDILLCQAAIVEQVYGCEVPVNKCRTITFISLQRSA